MKNNPLFCLVGRGSIGTRHLKNLKLLSYNNIKAFSEKRDDKKEKDYIDKYRVETVYNIEQFNNIKPDAFIVANPTAKHIEFAKAAMGMDSHVFMEKPLSDNLKGLYDLREDINSKNLVFCMGNNFRFHPVLVKLKELIENGRFGDIYFSRIMAGQYLADWHPQEDYRYSYSARKDLGGGVVLTLQHEIDYAYWLFGRFKSSKSYIKKVSRLDIEVESVASIIIESESGQLIEIHLDYLQRPAKRTVQIQGQKGSVDYCFGDRYLKFYDFHKQEYENLIDLCDYDNNQMYIDEMKNFIQAISGKEKPRSSFEDGLYILETCIKIKEGGI